MRKQKTAYELARSQVETPQEIVRLFWRITHNYRSHFTNVLDLGAGDGRFATGGCFDSYEGVEIDKSKRPFSSFPQRASINYICAFKHKGKGYAACIGNPPYVRHHDLDAAWRDRVAMKLGKEAGVSINRKCNLYVYFIFLAILKSKRDGLVSALVPYEWVSRPAAAPLREYIKNNKWNVDTYRFSRPIFNGVLTTASISVIDKGKKDGHWAYHEIEKDGTIVKFGQLTGSNYKILPYENRGKVWAMRGMSPGTQKVFTLTEGNRIHGGLSHDDVVPCVTSLRETPRTLKRLNRSAFRKHFIDAGAKCWLIRSNTDNLSSRLRAYLDNVPEDLRDTWTCTSRDLWYRYPLFDPPGLLVSMGFTSFGPKVIVNSIKAHAVGSVCGVYAQHNIAWSRLHAYLTAIDFEKRIVSHAKVLKKVEIRQFNAVLNEYLEQGKNYAKDKV